MRRILMLTVATALSLGVAAGAPGESGGATREAAQIGLSPEMKKLEFLLGKVTGKGKIYLPGQGTMDWSGSDNSAWTKDGRFLRSESKIAYLGMGDDESLTMMAYDQQAKLYKLWRFSSLATLPIEASGTFEGEKLVMVTKPTDSGLVFRVTFEPKAKGEVTFLLEMKMGESYEKFQDGVFTVKP